MESEECAPAPAPTTSSARNRKRGGIGLMSSSSVEAPLVVASHHHDKVLRSHTRRGRGGAGSVPPPVIISTPPSLAISRRRQRSSGCSSHTDEDDIGGGSSSISGEYGEVSVSLLSYDQQQERGNIVEEEVASGGNHASSGSNNNNSKGVVVVRRAGGEQAVIIPSSTVCFAPTNETKELCEQAGLLGGTTKTTTIHSGGTRLSSSCIPPHNDLATQQCRSNNAGEHSSSGNDNKKNCCEKLTQEDNRSGRRSRQHGHHHHHLRERSTPPAADAAGGGGDEDDEILDHVGRRGRRESGDDKDEMCGEDAASCELSGKPNTAQQSHQSSSSSSSLSLLAQQSSSSLLVGPVVSVSVTSCGTGTQVKSERGSENGGKEKESLSFCGAKRGQKDFQEVGSCESVISIKRDISEISVDTGDLTGGAGGLKLNKIGGHDGRWSAGEDARQGKDKDGAKGERKVFSSPSSSSLPSSSAVVSSVSMPQKTGVKGSFQDDGGGGIPAASAAGNEQSRQTKTTVASSPSVTVRCVKKSGATAAKKQSANSFAKNNNNNISSGGGAQSGGKSSGVERKKAPMTAPMLFMNNLPYMGELTFDTRPRRGRKPKKADICHLISKNYGIQFPAGVTQATLANSLPIINSKPTPVSATGLGSTSKKTRETITVSANNVSSSSRSLVPPAFCNRDVSIVPIIPTTWGSGGGSAGTPLSLPITTDSSKCSPSASNLLKPLSSLAQQLMLHHHQNPHCSAASTRSMATITSSSQQTISMFPLPTTPSFSQAHLTANSSKRSKTYGRGADYNAGEEEDENMMEVDVELHEGGDGDDEDNQDSPLNLCMRDKTMVLSHHRHHEPLSLVKEESLDVRWNRSGGGASKGAVRSSSISNSSNCYPSDGAKDSGSNKRSMMQSSSANNAMMKGGKSAKLIGSTSRASSSSLNFSLVNSSGNNVCDSDSVNNLVSCRPSPSPSSSPFGSAQQTSKLSPNIFAISAHHLQPHGGEAGGKSGGGGKGKQGGQSRKRRDVNLRGDMCISGTGSPGSQSGGTPSGSSAAPLSSFGGTLFGQSTAGINDGAEVSICKFKFTGGAKPCLQEKKMLSVDSGGNFRFYSDKTSGTGGGSGAGSTGKLSGKGQPQQLPLTSSSYSSNALYSAAGRQDVSQSPPSAGADGMECHYALSSLPKSAKSMSMCMPQGTVSSSGVQVQMSSSSTTTSSSAKGKGNSVVTKLSLPLMPSTSSSSSAATVNPYAALSISPTTEELQQLHLSMQDQQQQSRSSSRVSPYPSGGDYSYSSSNSCSSSDNCFGGDTPSSSSAKSGTRQASSSHQYRGGSGGSSGKMKLKRKRRTRKSLMREKLEKTFKEKGFLIQTQQLESAEGATYCKFRQLRKFTRYLFRSWKDYLPDHVKEISDNNANNNNNGALPGSEEQALANCNQTGNSAEQKDGSNVQSIADDEGDLDDDEDDGDEEDEVDSEEQLRQSLISHDNTIIANDEEDDSDEDEEEDGVTVKREALKASRHRKGKRESVGMPEIKKVDSLGDRVDDTHSNKEDDNEDVELQVDA